MAAIHHHAVHKLNKSEFSELHVPVPYGKLSGLRWGPATGQPVLMLHGWQDNANSMLPLVQFFPADWQVVALEFGGHGRSDPRPEGWVESDVDKIMDIARCVQYLKWEKFVIIAHSMGGIVASIYSGVFPDKVQCLVILDSIGLYFRSTRYSMDRLTNMITSYLDFEQKEIRHHRHTIASATKRLMEANKDLSPESAHLLIQRGTRPEGDGVVFSRDLRLKLPGTTLVSRGHTRELARRSTSPKLLVGTTEGLVRINLMDGLEIIETQRQVSKAFQMVEVQGNHHVHMNHPERVAPLICDFVLEALAKTCPVHLETKSKL